MSIATLIVLTLSADLPNDGPPVQVRVPISAAREIEVGGLLRSLAKTTHVDVAQARGVLSLPVVGLGGALSRKTLSEILGPGTTLEVDGDELVVSISPAVLAPDRVSQWQSRLRQLADLVERDTARRMQYGMHALKSYRPNDPRRPTVCLVHGLNSSSGGFVHMIAPLEEAGYGVVVYDYPYNRRIAESCARFRRDWSEFRRQNSETRPWAIVAHSMGALVARGYVEDPDAYHNDVASLVLVGPVVHGSGLAKAQTLRQLVEGLQAVRSKQTAEALSQLGDGLGEAAEDMTPGSAFLTELNRRPRRAGVPYHILAGDGGVLNAAAREKIEAQVSAVRHQRGLLGAVSRLATNDLDSRLDELSDGTGDGCIAVERTRLAGVTDHVVIHANHAELIRAPLLFREPGPVACMPYVLRCLKADLPPATAVAFPPAR